MVTNRTCEDIKLEIVIVKELVMLSQDYNIMVSAPRQHIVEFEDCYHSYKNETVQSLGDE